MDFLLENEFTRIIVFVLGGGVLIVISFGYLHELVKRITNKKHREGEDKDDNFFYTITAIIVIALILTSPWFDNFVNWVFDRFFVI